ncbi:hypothetical protein VTN00DRAFT_4900 [Thermoascus crustaceus]|uniref:uncharacterized protein n=1 Tax=Thermoascus crustaceus TaxID=5088 RepID=UPI003742CA12
MPTKQSNPAEGSGDPEIDGDAKSKMADRRMPDGQRKKHLMPTALGDGQTRAVSRPREKTTTRSGMLGFLDVKRLQALKLATILQEA